MDTLTDLTGEWFRSSRRYLPGGRHETLVVKRYYGGGPAERYFYCVYDAAERLALTGTPYVDDMSRMLTEGGWHR